MKRVLTVVALLTLTLSIFPRAAISDNISVKFGPGIEEGALTGSTKTFGVRLEQRQFRGLFSAVEMGGFVDNGGHGRKSSGLFKGQVGATPGPSVGVFGKAFVGPCLLTDSDSQLGGTFPQFCTDIGVGVRDQDNFMSIGYAHISSAGLRMPNHGRDYCVFELGVSF